MTPINEMACPELKYFQFLGLSQNPNKSQFDFNIKLSQISCQCQMEVVFSILYHMYLISIRHFVWKY